jgi:7,8-dihydropterin-6-yl-methyl-4-(beta-D-ribofuranosyl)aminobenzene 5'-phosphate synthase
MSPDEVRVVVLVDNAKGAAGLRARWGLSFWIETPHARVLLDCGDSDVFVHNAERLGIALETADAFVLSHGHYDHGGGIGALTALAPTALLVVHPGASSPRYSLRRSGKRESIGLQESSLAALRTAAARTLWMVSPLEVAPGVWASGPVPRRHPLEQAESTFFLDPSCTVRDHVVDDQAVWVETPAGLIVLCGCAHSGVINTVRFIRETVAGSGRGRTSDDPGCEVRSLPAAADGLPVVRALIGGLHLLHAGRDRLRATSEFLATIGLESCAPCHCTGKRATKMLRDRLPDAFVEVATGCELRLACSGGRA